MSNLFANIIKKLSHFAHVQLWWVAPYTQHVVEHSVFCKMQTKSIIIIFLCKFWTYSYVIHWKWHRNRFAVLLGVFSLTKVKGKIQGKKIPSIIKKLNKALGLERNSEKVWDILSISDNAANIAKYHPNETSKWLCRCCTKYLPQISYHEKYQ